MKLTIKSNYLIQPFLFAISPIVFLYNLNKDEVFFHETVLPLLIAISATIIFLILLNFTLKNLQKTCLIISIFWITFFSFGHVYYPLKNSLSLRNTHTAILIMATFLILFTLFVLFTLRSKKLYKHVSHFLTITALILVFLPLTEILIYKFRSGSAREVINFTEDIDQAPSVGEKPEVLRDIYYLIFDRYGSLDTLQDIYQFDNSKFMNSLEKKGFYVAYESRCNYPATYLSLSSSLNMKYINELTEEVSAAGFKKAIYKNMLDYKVWRFLKKHGYTFIHFGTKWNALRVNPFADKNYNSPAMPEFLVMIYQNTLAYPIGEVLFDFGIFKEQYNRVLYKFDKLETIPQIKSPTFTFVHFALPHDPFVFDKDGNYQSQMRQIKQTRKENYLHQLQFANKKISALIEALISGSETPPIIIIQSDEGPKPKYDFDSTDKIAGLKAHTRILNAYYLPEFDKSKLYQSISPVNTFRIIFNGYFKTQFEKLEDRVFIYENHSFIDKTDVVY